MCYVEYFIMKLIFKWINEVKNKKMFFINLKL